MNDIPETPLTKRYQELLNHSVEIAKQCGRDPQEISLIVVSKFHPWNELIPLYTMGQQLFGESRFQELSSKVLEAPPEIHWHFIGPLQKNKVRKAITKCKLIHSVDSIELARKISECSEEAGTVTHILLQINISGETSKQGMSKEECLKRCDLLRSLPNLSIDGLMTMAPLSNDSAIIRDCFAKLRLLREELRQRYGSDSFPHLSMGMSQDYPLAILEGATLLRIGSAIFAPPNQ